MSRIGDAIKAERQACGMTSRQLAEAVTLTPQYIRLIDCGRAVPSMETVLKIANCFPDVDSTAWLWLLLADLWGEPIAEAMQRHAVAEEQRAEGREG